MHTLTSTDIIQQHKDDDAEAEEQDTHEQDEESEDDRGSCEAYLYGDGDYGDAE